MWRASLLPKEPLSIGMDAILLSAILPAQSHGQQIPPPLSPLSWLGKPLTSQVTLGSTPNAE